MCWVVGVIPVVSLDGKVGGGLAHKVVVGLGSGSWVMLVSS